MAKTRVSIQKQDTVYYDADDNQMQNSRKQMSVRETKDNQVDAVENNDSLQPQRKNGSLDIFKTGSKSDPLPKAPQTSDQATNQQQMLQNTSPRVLKFLGLQKVKSFQTNQNGEANRMSLRKKEEKNIQNGIFESNSKQKSTNSEKMEGQKKSTNSNTSDFQSIQYPRQKSQNYEEQEDDINGVTTQGAPGCIPKIQLPKGINRSIDLKVGSRSKNNSAKMNSAVPIVQELKAKDMKLPYGLSLPLFDKDKPDSVDPTFGPVYSECYSPIDPQSFSVRGQFYQTDKKKVPSQDCVYDLVGADLISLTKKQYNIATIIDLPSTPQYSERIDGQSIDKLIPPILVVNILMPLYAPAILNPAHDGKGHSLIYYFRLSPNFKPSENEDQYKTYKLIRDTISQDFDSAQQQKIRNRMKLVPRVSNVEEFAKSIKLSRYQINMLNTYKDKPMLTRPCHQYFVDFERGYWEFDLDVHMYAYVLRQAFYQFHNKTVGIVFENSFVIQGDGVDELPEQLLCGIKVHRIDLTRDRKLEDMVQKYQNQNSVKNTETKSGQNAADGEVQ